MDCERIKELLLSYIDNEMDDDERKLVEVHLSGCAECTAEMEALAVTGSRLRQAYETVAAGVSPSAAVWQAIKNRVAAKKPTRERDTDRSGSRWRWLFGWRHPVWRTAVAGAAMLSFMIVFAVSIAPVTLPLWTADEQQAIDIAINDLDVQELLADKGVVYEVVPMNGEDDSNLYQVAFFNYNSADTSKELGANAWRGLQQTDGPSSVVSESDSNAAEMCVVFGGTAYGGKGVDDVNGTLGEDSVEIPVSVASNGSAIVDLDTATVHAYTSNTLSEGEYCLDGGAVLKAANIAYSDSRIGNTATVENVILLDEYDLEEGEFTDDLVLWVRLSISSGDIYFAQVDLDEQNVIKIVDGGE